MNRSPNSPRPSTSRALRGLLPILLALSMTAACASQGDDVGSDSASSNVEGRAVGQTMGSDGQVADADALADAASRASGSETGPGAASVGDAGAGGEAGSAGPGSATGSGEAPPAADEGADAAIGIDAPPAPPELRDFVPLADDPNAPPDAAALGIPLLPADAADAPGEEPATLYRDITWLGLEGAPEGLAEGGLWAVWTTGFLGFRNAPHVLGLYERQAEGWRRLAQLALTDEALPASERGAEPGAPPQPFPPMVDERSVTQVEQAPKGWIWLSVSGGWGANGGAFQLVGFDGQALSSLMALLEVFPGSTQVSSLDGDDIAELIEDRTDGYVLCRACGVREAGLRIHVFDPSRQAFAPAELVPAPAAWEKTLRQRADRSVALAEAGLWKEAARLMDEVERALPESDAGPSSSSAHAWTRETIRLNAEARRALAEPGAPASGNVKPADAGSELSGAAGDDVGSDGGAATDAGVGEASEADASADLPAPSIQLMHRMFYGDYAAVLAQMRRYPAAEHFGAAPPLLDANMSEPQLDRIIAETEPVLEADPQSLGAWLLRGWALSLRYPGRDEGPLALVRASELAPSDAFVAAMAAEAR